MVEEYHVIGLMSGTSLDGLDMAYVKFSVEANNWHYDILEAASILYSDAWRHKLSEAINLSQGELKTLDLEYGNWLGQQVRRFIKDHDLKVDMVSSHGHTVFHQPQKGLTLQIGDGQTIADITGLRTICEFRSGDVALGGQGAPLVPIGDQLLFSDYTACLNLGGIANISFDQSGRRIAFDIGMANMPINHFARERGLNFDKDGLLAAKGEVCEPLFNKLNELDYYQRKAPKSLGLEWFISEMLPLINSFNIALEDKMATLVHHEAWQISRTISVNGLAGNILVTGGGALNPFFIKTIGSYLDSQVSLFLPSAQMIEYKEALIFGLMGVLRWRNQINCLKSVTGARHDSSAGNIYTPTSN